MSQFEASLQDYETQCRDMDGPEQLEESALAFRAWRDSQRAEHQAYERWLVICGVRLEAPENEEAVIIPFPRAGEPLIVEGEV